MVYNAAWEDGWQTGYESGKEEVSEKQFKKGVEKLANELIAELLNFYDPISPKYMRELVARIENKVLTKGYQE